MEKPRCFWRIVLAVLAALLLRECFAMPHGQRDWSNLGADEVVHGLQDMAELAARLGSIDTFNREGNIVYLETFEHGLSSWLPTTYGTGAEVIVTAATSRHGGYCAKITGGSDGGQSAKIFRKFPYPVLGNYGLEISVSFEQYTYALLFRLVYHDGTDEHLFVIYYLPDADQLALLDENGTPQLIAGDLDLNPGYCPFQTFKLVADLVNDRYLRLIVNETEYDISDYACQLSATSDAPNVRVDILIYSEAGHNGWSYVDDIILTQNEPP